jgi:hypothetical protein
MIKKLILAAIAAATMMSGTAQARLGFTLPQCRAAYGKEVKVEQSWCGGVAYSFNTPRWFIYTIFGPDGRVGDIIYFDKSTWKAPLPAARLQLWSENVDKGRVWEDSILPDWDGRRILKSLGNEHFEHWLMYEHLEATAMVANIQRDTGWQIRSMNQFMLEQHAIKERSKAHQGS